MSALRSPRSSSPSASPYTPSDRVKLEVTILDAETTTPSAPEVPAPGASKRPPGAGPAAVIVLLLLLGAAFPGVSRAQIVVTSTNDSGPGSLRQAVADAAWGETITFDAALNGRTLVLTVGQMVLDKHLTIDATHLPDGFTIDASGASRHFWVERKRVVTLKGLTLVNGREQEDGRGGAIHNQGGTLTLEDCTLANNSAIEGGAIYSMMSLDMYWDPELGGPAGEGWILGHLTIRRSTLVGNEATEEGGAIYSSTGMTLVGSTIYDNVAGEHGGGLYNDPLNETLDPVSRISHTTITGNTAHGVGGGIAHIATRVDLLIDNSTIVENAAYGSYGKFGGGDTMTADAIFTAVTGATSFSSSRVTVTSSVVSGVAETPAPDCHHHPLDWQFGTNVIVLHHSLDASGNCNYNDIGAGNITGDPMLGPLQDNGGPTLTHLPLVGSPLIDAGVCDGDTDQRGYARSVDVPGYANSTSACDIGAVEVQLDDVLPVELTAFTAVRDGGTVRLSWQTSGEVNNAGFHVEHRSVGAPDAAWQELGFVEGAGTTLEARRYVFDTDVLTPGRYAFRLRQVDTDGAFSYSPEVELAVGVEGEAHLSSATPNPFAAQTRLRLAVSQPQVVRIAAYDALGREVARLWEGSLEADRTMEVVWEAGSLPSGVYFVRVEGEQFVRTQRVMLVR